jgi:uncharacterized protein YjbI with pentapeptide repeats
MVESHPELTEYGYEVVQVLGHNYGSARSTYLAKKIVNQQLVVVKLFCFPKSANQFLAYEKAIAREAQILSQLQHPMIPCYLNRFDTPDGYCLVQEYIEARSLANQHSFNLQQIQHIAIAALEVLVYLQSQTPPVIHRDLKPENLLVSLVSDDLKLYLVDFGFARIGMTDVALSSVAAGTFGFMAPEQLRNSNLNKATDLYGLGMTLICLLTGIRSTQIDHLIDEANQIEFQHLLTNVSSRFVKWLKRMTAPRLKDRYSDAAIALAALKQIGDIGVSAKASASRWQRMPIYLLPVAAIASLLTIFPNPSSENISSNLSQTLPSNPCSKYRHLKLTKTEEQEVSDSIAKLQIYRKCRGCKFRGARFIPEDLKGVDLQNADLRGVNLMQADLSGANLKGAKLEGANFTQANLEDVDFSETTSTCADFGQAELQKAKLVRANLTAANFSQADMTGSDLSYANLTSADLTQTDLSKANLNYVDLTNTNLLQTVLKNATVEGVTIKNTKIEQTDLPKVAN